MKCHLYDLMFFGIPYCYREYQLYGLLTDCLYTARGPGGGGDKVLSTMNDFSKWTENGNGRKRIKSRFDLWFTTFVSSPPHTHTHTQNENGSRVDTHILVVWLLEKQH